MRAFIALFQWIHSTDFATISRWSIKHRREDRRSIPHRWKSSYTTRDIQRRCLRPTPDGPAEATSRVQSNTAETTGAKSSREVLSMNNIPRYCPNIVTRPHSERTSESFNASIHHSSRSIYPGAPCPMRPTSRLRTPCPGKTPPLALHVRAMKNPIDSMSIHLTPCRSIRLLVERSMRKRQLHVASAHADEQPTLLPYRPTPMSSPRRPHIGPRR